MEDILGNKKQLRDKQLVQCKVDKELYYQFRELKEIKGQSIRRMFEDFMISQLAQVEHQKSVRDLRYSNV